VKSEIKEETLRKLLF